jgi:hypothetical protein
MPTKVWFIEKNSKEDTNRQEHWKGAISTKRYKQKIEKKMIPKWNLIYDKL